MMRFASTASVVTYRVACPSGAEEDGFLVKELEGVDRGCF